jgi:cytochrome c-type biogenesis protein CcmF
MIPQIGQYALVLAFCMAILQAVIPLWGTFYNNVAWMRMAKSTAVAQFFFIGVSLLCLTYSLWVNDFSVAYVAQNSNQNLPLIYRICAVWGAHEGSLLLWVFILSIWMSSVALLSKSLPLAMVARVLAILGMISLGFLLFLLTSSNPFVRILSGAPINGHDLNPLLQDPGLAIHPPMLYMGYVGFSVAFAFAIAALIEGRFDAAWARWSRPWTLVAWSFLTLGITLGSWWAYRVLGWGGWWFWDPVENASFLPWLVGTALIHSLVVAEKRNTFKTWTVLLAIFAFSLSLMGTFLVRSGILVSVHTFAIDPQRGAFMLKFLAIVVGGSLFLYAWRGQKIKNMSNFQLWSRETMLLSNNVLLTTAMATVLLGTLYPLVIDALGLGKLSVGPPYFNSIFVPIMLPLLFLMGIGPLFHWQATNVMAIIKRLKYSMLLAILLALLLPWLLFGELHLGVILGLMLAFWVILATFQDSLNIPKNNNDSWKFKSISRTQWGRVIAHSGFAICAIGIIITSAYSTQRDVRMSPHDLVTIGPYQVQFAGTKPLQGPNYNGHEGKFVVFKNAKIYGILNPQLRVYTVQKMALAKTAILIRPFHDLYIALGEALENDAWSMRIYYKPFVRWIWLGGILMLCGGIIAAMDRRSLSRFDFAVGMNPAERPKE